MIKFDLYSKIKTVRFRIIGLPQKTFTINVSSIPEPARAAYIEDKIYERFSKHKIDIDFGTRIITIRNEV